VRTVSLPFRYRFATVSLPFGATMSEILTPEEIEWMLESGDDDLVELAKQWATLPYQYFQSRPDNEDLFDQQTSFIDDSKSRFSICLGGTGSGKTIAAAVKTANFLLGTRPPRARCPFWIVGETLEQICQVAWLEKLSQFITDSAIAQIAWHSYRRKWPRSVLLKNPYDPSDVGWVIEFKSYEQGLGSMKAASIGGYWCNEEIPYHMVFEIQGRCRDYNSPGWADFTPLECKDPEWPIAYELCQQNDPSAPKGWRFYHLNTECNEAVADWWIGYKKGIPTDTLELRQYGRFTNLSGTVYKEWNPARHIVEPFRIPHDWLKIRMIDFGFNNPFCCLWGARDHDGRWWIYDEHYESQKLNVHHAQKIGERNWQDGEPHFGQTFTDHDAQQRAELENYGIRCTPANKAINQGIEYIRTLMHVGADKLPSLVIFNTCRNLIREIPRYRWPDGTDQRNPRDVPMDVDNHALDALRYGLYSMKSAGAKLGVTTSQSHPGRSRVSEMFKRSRR